ASSEYDLYVLAEDGNSNLQTTPAVVSVSNVILENALSFDGTDDYVEITHNSGQSLSDFTLEAWVNTTQTAGAYKRIIMKPVGGNQNYSLAINNGFAHVRFDGSGGVQAEGSSLINDGEWHHIAGVFDNTNDLISIYVDGVLEQQNVTTQNPVTGSSPLYLGWAGSGGIYYEGEMDEVRIWSTVRTQEEILINMNSSLATGTGLVASYDFNTGTPGDDNTGITTLTDITGNGNDGTLNNFGLSGSSSNWVVSDAFGGVLGQATIIGTTTSVSNNGLTVTDAGFLQDAGDFVTFTYSNASTDGAVTTNINPNVIDSRWERDWYISSNDANTNGGEVEITFDFSDMGVGGTPSGKYALLYRENETTQYQAVVFSYTISGDQVTFIANGADIEEGYYTLGQVTTRLSTIIYVKKNAQGAYDGTSWSNAFDNLQGALAVAGTDVEIWVAKGTYIPHSIDREVSFRINDTGQNNLTLYGGFAGNETLETERDPELNITILSGDLFDDDNANVTPGETTRQDNSLHVLYTTSVVGLTIDGFKITGGNANDSGPTFGKNGGGIINFATIDIYNCTFDSNTSSDEGAGLWYSSGSSDLINVTVSNNHASVDGGGMYSGGNPRIFNCVFEDNIAQNGAGLYLTAAGSLGIITNSIFQANDASLQGGAIYATGTSSTEIINNTIYGNSATNDGGGIYIASNSSNPIKNNIIWDNFATNGANVESLGSSEIDYNLISTGAIGVNGLSSDPLFADANNGDFTVTTGSGAINAGDNASIAQDRPDLDDDADTSEDVPFDFAGNARVQNDVVDMGAYEFEGVGNATERGNSLDFDGLNDHIIVNTNSPFLPNEETDDYTIETWFKTADRNSDQGI
ncbi:MAG: LamG-like jellyroll fold domain-containing protein, partial [Marinoscillum sp.]